MTRSRLTLHPILALCLCVACFGVAAAIFETTLNNYLSATFGLTAGERGRLEFPRELPGFLTAVFAGALLFLPEARMGVVAAAAVAAGLFGLAQVDIGYNHMLVWLVLWSCGAHLFMPLEASLAIQHSEEGRSGARLGQVGFGRTVGSLLGSLFVWKVLGRFSMQYRVGFLCAGGAALIAALVLIKIPGARSRSREPTRFVLKKRYSLFYIMCVLFGARKQVFITFGPWVLVKVFDQPHQVFGQLWFISGVLALAFKPLLGKLIDSVGERAVLVADGIILMAVCLGYGFAGSLLPPSTAVLVLKCCYVIDHLMFSAGMARNTYMSKIAEDVRDITPTFSLGVSINHAVSMTVPLLGGMLWMWCDSYRPVFMVAAGVALLTAVASAFVRVPKTPRGSG